MTVKRVSLGICGFLLAIISSAAELPPPLIDLPLNEGEFAQIHDEAGNKVTVINPEFLSWADGPSGKALTFNNNDGSCKRGAVEVLFPTQTDLSKGFSVAVDVRLDKSMVKNRKYCLARFSDSHSCGPGFRFYIYWQSARLLIGDGDDKTKAEACSKTVDEALIGGKWYRIIGVFDGKKASVYINGRLAAAVDGVIANPKLHKRIMLGTSSSNGAGYGLAGTMANFKFYAQPLTPQMIDDLSNEE